MKFRRPIWAYPLTLLPWVAILALPYLLLALAWLA